MKRQLLVFLVTAMALLVGCDDQAPYGSNEAKGSSGRSLNTSRDKIAKSINPQDASVRGLAVRLSSMDPTASVKENNLLNKAAIIHAFLCNEWKYVEDPSLAEYVASARETIDANYTGDCDDFSVLLASLLEAVGIETRIVLAFRDSDNIGHAFVEANFGHDQNTLSRLQNAGGRSTYRKDRHGNIWINFDWTGNIPGGEFFYSDTQWIYDTQQDKWYLLER